MKMPVARRFIGKTYAADILLEANDFEAIGFDAHEGARLQISVWEDDAGAFDVFLLAGCHAMKNAYRVEKAILRSESTCGFDSEYILPDSGRFYIVISNVKAHIREKLVHVALAWSPERRSGERTHENPAEASSAQSARRSSVSRAGGFLILLLCAALSAVAACSVTGNPVAVTAIGLAVGIVTVFISLLTREIRQAIGLQED